MNIRYSWHVFLSDQLNINLRLYVNGLQAIDRIDNVIRHLCCDLTIFGDSIEYFDIEYVILEVTETEGFQILSTPSDIQSVTKCLFYFG